MTVLAMLALASALLAGAFAQAIAAQRAARSARASVVAAALARRALARAVVAWGAAEDSLAVGGTLLRALPESAAVLADAADTRLRVQRLSASLYVVASDVAVVGSLTPLARRRAHLLLDRRAALDSTLPILPPQRLVRWSVGELY